MAARLHAENHVHAGNQSGKWALQHLQPPLTPGNKRYFGLLRLLSSRIRDKKCQ
jgi:hypothetical protein